MTELSDQPFAKVEDVISKGMKVTAKVIKIEIPHKKVALSIKECLVKKNQVNHDDIVVSMKGAKKLPTDSTSEEEKDRPE